MSKHWSKMEYLSQTVKNTNIIVKGSKSYYSDAWTGGFEESVVRYLYGDEYSLKAWQPMWKNDKLYIGNYVCIGAEVIILMGGNNTHRNDWFSNYPFMECIVEAYKPKGDTQISDGVWLGMRSMIMPGIKIGEGAVVAAGSIVTKDVAPYTIVGGNPAKLINKRFDDEVINKILSLKIYDLSEEKIDQIIHHLCSNDIAMLEEAVLAAKS